MLAEPVDADVTSVATSRAAGFACDAGVGGIESWVTG